MNYKSHRRKDLEQLKLIVGEKNYEEEQSRMSSYLVDWGNKYQGISPLILKPVNTQMVSEILTFCNEFKIGVVPQGGNTGLVGGSVPSNSGLEIVISLEKMNKILDIDVLNFTMTLEAGCILIEVQEAAKKVDRLFPLSLASEGSCQIGGNLSTNAGGTAVLRYGNTKELVLGIEVVMPNGEIINQLRRLRKDNTGYDIKQLFLGAEGTLGIITKAVLKLFPLPKQKVTSLIAIPDLPSTIELFSRLRELSGDNLTAIEYIDRTCIDILIENTELEDVFKYKYEHYALIEFSSSEINQGLQSLLENSLSDLFEDGLALDAVISSSESQALNLWKVRETIPGVLRRCEAFLTFDASVPVSLVPEFILRATTTCNEICELGRVAAFGHIGDGNIHFYILKSKNDNVDNFISKKSEIIRKINEIILKLDGSFSAEHGIGVLKKSELRLYKSNSEINLMEQIKKTLDPNNIMNPGKVL
jgi:FAD/FMN-containing dehydrogenase